MPATFADPPPLEFIALLEDDAFSGGTVGVLTSSGAAQSDSQAAVGTESAAQHWSTTRQYYDTGSLELTLHEELIDFSEAYRPTRAEHAARVDAIERVRELVAGLPSFASAEVHPFGSFATGIYLPSSDIDLVVLDSGHVDKMEQVEGLRLIELALRSARWRAEHIEVIASAKVPIVKYLDCVSGLAVDICLETRDGLRSSALARKAAERFPAFRHLVLLLKRWLISRGLNDTFTGGVGSFLLMLLVIASLQQPPLQPPTLPGTQHNLGRCLLHFFELFGMRLNTMTVGIRVCNSPAHTQTRTARPSAHLPTCATPSTPSHVCYALACGSTR
jgi:non-canonical poly(A) RNA polymerase PAPD5/7